MGSEAYQKGVEGLPEGVGDLGGIRGPPEGSRGSFGGSEGPQRGVEELMEGSEGPQRVVEDLLGGLEGKPPMFFSCL